MSFDARALLRELDDAKLEALVETMYLAADADGELATEECAQLASSIRHVVAGSSRAGALDGDRLNLLIDRARDGLARDGRPARLASVRDRLGDAPARKAALALAVQVMAADGIVRTSERELIVEMAEALELDAEEAADLVRTLTRPR